MKTSFHPSHPSSPPSLPFHRIMQILLVLLSLLGLGLAQNFQSACYNVNSHGIPVGTPEYIIRRINLGSTSYYTQIDAYPTDLCNSSQPTTTFILNGVYTTQNATATVYQLSNNATVSGVSNIDVTWNTTANSITVITAIGEFVTGLCNTTGTYPSPFRTTCSLISPSTAALALASHLPLSPSTTLSSSTATFSGLATTRPTCTLRHLRTAPPNSMTSTPCLSSRSSTNLAELIQQLSPLPPQQQLRSPARPRRLELLSPPHRPRLGLSPLRPTWPHRLCLPRLLRLPRL